MSYLSAVLLNRILLKKKTSIEVEVEGDEEEENHELEDNVDTEEMAAAIVKVLEGHEPVQPDIGPEYPEISERIAITLPQKVIGFDPMTKVKKLVDEANRHHPVDDTHTIQKVVVERMPDGSNSMFVEWMKCTY